MVTRIAPTADALSELLTEQLGHRSARDAVAAPLDAFLRFVQTKLHTNSRSARLWVKNVAVADGAPFRIISTRHGVPTFQLVPRSDTGGAFLYEHERRGWFDSFSSEATPKLTDFGVLNKTMGSSNREFVIHTGALANLVIEAAKRHDQIKIERAAARAAELDAIEADHGEGIALLRGLLYAAGIPRKDSTLNIRRHTMFEGQETFTNISVELTGAQLDQLTPVLRELGIKPRNRTKLGSAEVRPEA